MTQEHTKACQKLVRDAIKTTGLSLPQLFHLAFQFCKEYDCGDAHSALEKWKDRRYLDPVVENYLINVLSGRIKLLQRRLAVRRPSKPKPKPRPSEPQ